jgi:hypothetical protein
MAGKRYFTRGGNTAVVVMVDTPSSPGQMKSLQAPTTAVPAAPSATGPGTKDRAPMPRRAPTAALEALSRGEEADTSWPCVASP